MLKEPLYKSGDKVKFIKHHSTTLLSNYNSFVPIGTIITIKKYGHCWVEKEHFYTVCEDSHYFYGESMLIRNKKTIKTKLKEIMEIK